MCVTLCLCCFYCYWCFLWQVDVYSEKKGLVIVGYYHANQRLDDNRYSVKKHFPVTVFCGCI